MTGFWQSLFREPLDRAGTPKRRRTASLHTEKQLDALVESFAQASIARQALQSSQGSYVQPLSSSGGLYRQEIPMPRPIEEQRPLVKTWQAPPSPVYHNPFLVEQSSYQPVERLPRPMSEPILYAPPPSTPKKTRAYEPQGKPNQCRGTTTAGKRCTRIVGPATSASASPARAGGKQHRPLTEANLTNLNRVLSRKGGRRKGPAPASDSEDSAAEDNEELPRFCHQHAKAAVEEPGTFAGRHGTWVVFDDWIPPHLPQETRIQLRYEMARPTTAGDKPGYLYVHEMARSTTSASPTTYLKIGRSVRPVARLSQWKNQCPSRTPIVRGLFPLPFGTNASTLGGALAVNPIPAPFHHRWERLVLIEIAGRAQLVHGEKLKEGKCVDCGRKHTELFSVERGAYELYVIETIQRWQNFCTRIL